MPARQGRRTRKRCRARAFLPPAAPLTVAGHGPQRGVSRLLSTPLPHRPLTRGRSGERRVRGPLPVSPSFSSSSLSTPPTPPPPAVKYKCCSLMGRCVGSWRRLRPRPSAGGGRHRRGEAAETLRGLERPTLRALYVGLGSRRPAGKRGPSPPPGHHSVRSPSAAPSERTDPFGGAA